MTALRVGVCLPQFTADGDALLRAAAEIEQLGYDAASVFDHLSPLGGPPTRPILESFTTLTAVAARTSRLTVLPLVARAGLRPPATLAHMVRTIDLLAPGRFVLGLGAGDDANAGEDAAIGLPVLDTAGRHDQVRAAVAAVRESTPAVPIWLGGTGPQLRRMAGEIADGWNVWGLPAAEVARRARTAQDAAGAAGRPALHVSWGGPVLVAPTAGEAQERAASWQAKGTERASTQLVRGDPAGLAAGLHELATAGVSTVLLSFVGDGAAEQRRLFAREVLPLVRAAA
ncbi:MAG: LLM class flavin-dependent oxidoreductase [Mycobacteriales bacterium]|nr:LLM class flavin-dependent oxidoreductase [Frankia sp.]